MQYIKFFFRFQDGLMALGVLDEIQAHPDILREVFVKMGDTKFHSETFHALFSIDWSSNGSNRMSREETNIGYWLDLLQDNKMS